ncbi:MAG: hypothetical protein RIS82_167 [Actinomycetota bacterium]
MDLNPSQPPLRRAMTDAELEEALGDARSGPDGVAAAMALLEQQSALREADSDAQVAWLNRIANPAPVSVLAEPAVSPIESSLVSGEQVAAPEKPASAVEAMAVTLEEPLRVVDSENVEILPEAPRLAQSTTTAFSEMSAESIQVDSEPIKNRRSLAVSQFWAWFGLGGSLVPLVLGAIIAQANVSFLQGFFALGLASTASAVVIGVGSLAGKRSGLATVFLSRAAFGVTANIAPAIVLLASRAFWSLVLIWSAFTLAGGVTHAGVSAASQVPAFVLVALIAGLGATLAFFGGRILYAAQKASGLLGSFAGVMLFAVTASGIAWNDLLLEAAGSWVATFASATLVFAMFGLAWSGTGADFARKLSVDQLGVKVVAFALAALAIVPTLFGALGLALARGMRGFGPSFHDAFASNVFLSLVENLPLFISILMLLSLFISFVVLLAMSMYSTNHALHAIGMKLPPRLAQPLLGAILLLALLLIFWVTKPEPSFSWSVITDYAIFLAVPVAAWSGIFSADVLIRRIAYHEVSLSRTYGFYKRINIANLAGWVIASAIGFGLVDSSAPGIGWTGYLAVGLVNPEFWLSTNFGVVVALALGVLMPVMIGIPRIKKQEAEVLAIEARRTELLGVLGELD